MDSGAAHILNKTHNSTIKHTERQTQNTKIEEKGKLRRWKWVPAGDEHAEEERRNTENRNPFGGDLAGASVLHPLCVLERERERGEKEKKL